MQAVGSVLKRLWDWGLRWYHNDDPSAAVIFLLAMQSASMIAVSIYTFSQVWEGARGASFFLIVAFVLAGFGFLGTIVTATVWVVNRRGTQP